MMNDMNGFSGQSGDSESETGTAYEAVPSSAKGKPHAGMQTEFGLADLSIEDELEMTDLEEDGLSLEESADGAEFEAPADDEPSFLAGGESASLPDAPIEADGALLADIQSIPEKMAFKIGEAAEMVGVKQYVLRYWESEFEMLRPRKSRNGQRVYSRRDVECAMMIKKLLYNDRFSIEGARHALRQLKSTVKTVVKEEKTAQVMAKTQESAMMHMRNLLEDIRRIRQTL